VQRAACLWGCVDGAKGSADRTHWPDAWRRRPAGHRRPGSGNWSSTRPAWSTARSGWTGTAANTAPGPRSPCCAPTASVPPGCCCCPPAGPSRRPGQLLRPGRPAADAAPVRRGHRAVRRRAGQHPGPVGPAPALAPVSTRPTRTAAFVRGAKWGLQTHRWPGQRDPAAGRGGWTTPSGVPVSTRPCGPGWATRRCGASSPRTCRRRAPGDPARVADRLRRGTAPKIHYRVGGNSDPADGLPPGRAAESLTAAGAYETMVAAATIRCRPAGTSWVPARWVPIGLLGRRSVGPDHACPPVRAGQQHLAHLGRQRSGLGRPGQVEVHQPGRVPADPVVNLRCRYPVESVSDSCRVTRLLSSGRFGDVPHIAEWPAGPARPRGNRYPRRVVHPPRPAAGRVDRATRWLQPPLGAAHESRGPVRSRRTGASAGAGPTGPGCCPARRRTAGDHAERVQHQPPADQAEEFGQAAGMARPGGQQQQPGGTDAVGAHRVTAARVRCSRPSRSTQSAPSTSRPGRGPVAGPRAPVTSLDAGGHGVRPVGPVGAALGAVTQPHRQAARCTHGRSAPYRRVAIAFGPGHQCQPRSLCAGRPAGRSGPVARVATAVPRRRERRIAGQPGDAEGALDPDVVRLQGRRRSGASRRRRRRGYGRRSRRAGCAASARRTRRSRRRLRCRSIRRCPSRPRRSGSRSPGRAGWVPGPFGAAVAFEVGPVGAGPPVVGPVALFEHDHPVPVPASRAAATAPDGPAPTTQTSTRSSISTGTPRGALDGDPAAFGELLQVGRAAAAATQAGGAQPAERYVRLVQAGGVVDVHHAGPDPLGERQARASGRW